MARQKCSEPPSSRVPAPTAGSHTFVVHSGGMEKNLVVIVGHDGVELFVQINHEVLHATCNGMVFVKRMEKERLYLLMKDRFAAQKFFYSRALIPETAMASKPAHSAVFDIGDDGFFLFVGHELIRFGT